MDAVEFIKERNRMCKFYGDVCDGCPAHNVSDDAPICAVEIMTDAEFQVDAKKQVAIVEKWSCEHPRKTRQSVFLEQWPNAHKDRDGVVCFDPCLFDETIRTDECENKNCYKCRHKFWMQEVE